MLKKFNKNSVYAKINLSVDEWMNQQKLQISRAPVIRVVYARTLTQSSICPDQARDTIYTTEY